MKVARNTFVGCADVNTTPSPALSGTNLGTSLEILD